MNFVNLHISQYERFHLCVCSVKMKLHIFQKKVTHVQYKGDIVPIIRSTVVQRPLLCGVLLSYWLNVAFNH